MKRLIPILLLLISINSFSQAINETTEKNNLLSTIAKNITNYKSKTITLQLKLKHLDKIFEKITFYDKKNHDIEFDISDRFLKKRIATDMLNLHEGMEYNVTFVVQNVGNLGQIIGELKSFKPVILDEVPENSKK
jgi:hypothetical protein